MLQFHARRNLATIFRNGKRGDVYLSRNLFATFVTFFENDRMSAMSWNFELNSLLVFIILLIISFGSLWRPWRSRAAATRRRKKRASRASSRTRGASCIPPAASPPPGRTCCPRRLEAGRRGSACPRRGPGLLIGNPGKVMVRHLRPLHKTLEGSFSAVSKPFFSKKHLLCKILWYLQD